MKNMAMHILDIAGNSIEAGAAEVRVQVEELPDKDVFRLMVQDDGKGIAKEALAGVTHPYYTGRKSRKVGLGLSLLKQNAENTGGSLVIHSSPNKGTRVEAGFKYHHVDRPPLGDVAGAITMLMGGNPDLNLVYVHKHGELRFEISSREIKQALDGISISRREVRTYIRGMIDENLASMNVI